jgi:hypothetical protein
METQDLVEKYLVDEWATKWFVWISKVPNIYGYDVSMNDNITIDIIQNNLDFRWDADSLSIFCKSVYVKDMLQHPTLFVSNPNKRSITICANDSITTNMLKRYVKQMHYKSLSFNKNVTDKFLEKNMNKNWNWKRVAAYTSVTIDFIRKHPEIDWNWSVVSRNKNILMKDVLENPNLPWDWSQFFDNPTLTMDIIDNNPMKDWQWNRLGDNPNITIDFVLRHIDKSWNWHGISSNKNITMMHIKQYPNLPWDWIFINRNPSLSIKDIVTNPDKPWKFHEMGSLPFSTDKQNYINFRRNQINILTIHLHMQKVLPTVENQFSIKPIEHVLFDNYLVLQMNQY